MTFSRVILLGFTAALAAGGSALADESDFASPAAARDYLAATLPRATAENPKYRTVADGTVSQWLTQEVRFSGMGEVEMLESYTQEKDGKTTPGAHKAAFSLDDVELSEFTEAGDVTLDGAPARGVLFACLRPGCIEATWGDKTAPADKTDISLQDDGVRAKVLAAFRYLKTHGEQ
jgi:hypothetical protein